VETVSKEKITLALIGLCFVIGAMTLLSVYYYTRAISLQNQSNTQDAQITALQQQNTYLQQQITQRDAQIAQRDAQITSLNTQLSNLATSNQDLQTQLNYLYGVVDNLALRISQLESSNLVVTNTGGAGHVMRW
jgi:chromosome segregation ATPase